METVRNIPISCPSCRISVNGRETPTRRSDGSLVMECTWRCNRCGSFLKRGITKVVETKK